MKEPAVTPHTKYQVFYPTMEGNKPPNFTELASACLNGDSESFKRHFHLFLEITRTNEMSKNDEIWKNLFYQACFGGSLEIVQYLFPYFQQTLNEKNAEGKTPLIIACETGNVELASFLSKKGAILQNKNDVGESALHIACQRDYPKIVKLLLEERDTDVNDVNDKDGLGNTPLQYACSAVNLEIIKLLVEYGAKVTTENKKGECPVHTLVQVTNPDKIKKMEKCFHYLIGINTTIINAKNKKGLTPLNLICKLNNPKHIHAFQILLRESKVNINIPDNDGNSSLHNACVNNNHTNALMITQHVNYWKNEKNKKGETPVNICVSKSSGIIHLL